MAEPTVLATALSDRYRIERKLGEGGMATVYLARDVKHDRDVALKVLRPELAAILGRERFLNEIRLTAKLDHPHIVTLIDSGETESFLWYVLPFIRGESLRERLTREKQLGVPEALAISKQVASALDYAHRQGVIHRDLKPENILLHEGEAMLADFGIALAVQEAGGNRLTETGLSLGTPSYMSPEQATGDRVLDARSDVYSLGAVLYEMLAGEPPHTGATAQAVIAKLMTERPTRLRIVRDTVPEGVDAAVARALAKVPADRFGSVKEFAARLTAEPTTAPARRRRRFPLWVGAAVALLAITGAIAFRAYRSRSPVVVAAPVKMTSSGDITAAALSPDGTRLATSLRECDGTGRCTYALVWRDIGGGGELRIADRLGSLRQIEWSPDARHLVFHATDGSGRYGAFRVSALGGVVQFLGCCAVNFLTTADTVLLSATESPRGWILRVITPADGVTQDSVVLGPREGGLLARPSPTGKLIADLVTRSDSSRLIIFDRKWRRLDSIALPGTTGGGLAWDPEGNAVILKSIASEGSALAHLERVPVDGRGRLGAPEAIEGIAVSELGSFSIVGPNRTLAYVAGGQDWTVSALTRENAATLNFRSRLLRRSTSFLIAMVSPDGRFIHFLSRPAESPRLRSSILPFEGGAEVAIPTGNGELASATWTWNSSQLLYTLRGPGEKLTLYSFGLASGRARAIGPIAGYDRPRSLQAVGPDLIGWVDDSAFSIVLVDTNGVERRRIADPDRSERHGELYPSPDGRSMLTSRWSAGFDTLLFTRMDLDGGRRQRLGGLLAEEPAGILWEPGGGIQIGVLETLGTLAFYRMDPRGGRPVRLASYPAEGLLYHTFSRDGRRAVKVETRPRGDVWTARNFDGRVRP
jgi:hypothetical protein